MSIKSKKLDSILVVDDEHFIRNLLTDVLAEHARKLFTAKNGEEALVITKKEKPDLIISDVMMPVMNGFEFLEKVREDPTIKDTPFIILTVKDGPEDIELGKKFRANYYFPKPFDLVQLLRAVEDISKSQQSPEEQSQP